MDFVQDEFIGMVEIDIMVSELYVCIWLYSIDYLILLVKVMFEDGSELVVMFIWLIVDGGVFCFDFVIFVLQGNLIFIIEYFVFYNFGFVGFYKVEQKDCLYFVM